MKATGKVELLFRRRGTAKDRDSTICETIFKEIPIAILLLGKDYRILKTNNAFYGLLGINGAVDGRPFGEVITDDVVQQQVGELLRQESGRREVELCLDSRGGGRRILKVVMTRISRPSADGVLILIDDLSERIRSEEQLLQMEKIFAVDQLAAGIVHEIGNPLGIMKSTMSFLNDRLSKRGDELTTYTQVLMENVDRIHELLKDLSGFSRPQSDQFSLHDISKCLSQMVNFIERECEKQGVVIETSFENGLPPVYCNPHRLKLVFLNLFKNAIEAMPDGGRLSIKAGSVKGTVPRFTGVSKANAVESGLSPISKEMLRVEIMDTGNGILEEELNSIFKPFYTTKREGSGLGLFITRSIIMKHNGRITVRSRKGKGTVFSILLPTNEVDE